jgi:ubiquinone/menaquinone biosynthesis C-methylase UbiE
MKTNSKQVKMRELWDKKAKINAEGEVWRERDSNWNKRVEECLKNVLEPFTELLNKEIIILDLGCGMGRLSLPIAQRYPNVKIVGIDISPEMIKIAKQNSKDLKNIRYKVNDGISISEIDDNCIDLVYSIVTFQHIPNQVFQGYIKEISRILRKSGKFRIQFVEGNYYGFNENNSNEDDVIKWCDEAGLNIINIDRNLIFPKWTWITGEKK